MEAHKFWLISALVLIVLEFVIPGGVVVFLGLSALIVWALLAFGIIKGLYLSLIIWFISSIIMLLLLRSFFMKYFEGDSRVQSTDEDSDAYGQTVEVIEDVNPSHPGRIYFRGSSWSAKSEVSILKNEKATIVGRDSNTYIIKPFTEEM